MDRKDQELRIWATHLPDTTLTNVAYVDEGKPTEMPGLPFGDAPAHIEVALTCRRSRAAIFVCLFGCPPKTGTAICSVLATAVRQGCCCPL